MTFVLWTFVLCVRLKSIEFVYSVFHLNVPNKTTHSVWIRMCVSGAHSYATLYRTLNAIRRYDFLLLVALAHQLTVANG